MSKTDRIYIRVAPDLKEQLQQIAAGENRTISNYIESLIKRDLERRKTFADRSCKNCRHVCMNDNGTYKDIEGGCERWAHGGGR